ncbi:MAG TPA: energy transducer TonB [Gemmatimonadales bacterium]|nr:energy transducer TonB [Gemmatimonadales bacterium]
MVLLAIAVLGLARMPVQTLCPPDTTGRTSMVRVTLALAVGDHVLQDSDALSEHEAALAALLQNYRQPSGLSLPLWARYVETEEKPRDLHAAGYGLATHVGFYLDQYGRLADTLISVTSASPELNASLVAAVRRADSAGSLPNSTQTKKRHLILSVIDWDRRGSAPSAPLARVAVPVIRVDSGPSPISIPKPDYPRGAQRAGIEGRVELQYVVLETGQADPATFHVVRTNYREFAASAIEVIARGSFRPAQLAGCPVPILVQQKVSFKLAP